MYKRRGLVRAEAVSAMMDMIRADRAKLGIHHDLFSSEAELQAEGKHAAAETWLREHDLVYDGVLEDVSYTHLDVYKRQPVQGSPTCRNCWCPT